MWRLGRRPGALPGAWVASPAALPVLGGCSRSSSQQPGAEVRPRHVLAEGGCGACSGAASLKAWTLARRPGGPRMWSGGGGAEWLGGPGSVAASEWVPVPKVTCALAGPPPRQSCCPLLPGPPSAARARLSLSRQQDGPVPGAGSHLDACPLCSFCPSALGLPVCGRQAVERPQGPLTLTLTSVPQRQLPQLSLAEGRVVLVTGPRPGWAPGC